MKPNVLLLSCLFLSATAVSQITQKPGMGKKQTETEVPYIYDPGALDTSLTVNLREIPVVWFKSDKEWEQYHKYKSRIRKVIPYVKIARQLYFELREEKETSKKRAYRHYRKDLEKEMREKFEKELKNLSTGQGEMLFKLINRETGNNAFTLIKEVKGGFSAFFYQLVAKRWGYDLKDKYNPEQEKMVEYIIQELGPEYNVR